MLLQKFLNRDFDSSLSGYVLMAIATCKIIFLPIFATPYRSNSLPFNEINKMSHLTILGNRKKSQVQSTIWILIP